MPFEPAEFGSLFELALGAGQAETALDDAAAAELPEELLPTNPYRRAAVALKRRLGEDEARFQSALLRFCAVMELYTRGALHAWVREDARGTRAALLHPAVLDVAARMSLTRNGNFPRDRFLEQVSQTARERYADLAQWPPETPA